MKRLSVLVLAIFLVAAFGHVLPAQAVADLTSYSLQCDGASAIGTTTADYYVVEVYDATTGEDLIFDAFPTNADGTFSFNLFFPARPEGSFLEYWVWGTPTNDPEDWDGEGYFYTEGPCENRVPGPGAPAGFVLKTIVCTVPVYNSPAGTPVGENQVTAGQTWYVNPTPVQGGDGALWTEIFVSSVVNPWIPTACVGP